MPKIDWASKDLGRLDALANMDSVLHRLDPRAKVLTTLFFVILVTSFNKYEISGLLPFFIFPVVLIALGNLPFAYFFKKLLLVSPFVLFIGIFNPILDKEIIMGLGTFSIAGGWISLLSILIRFSLTVLAALLLVATTGFPSVCLALNKLGTPRVFSIQLLLLYRYIFVLLNEGTRMLRAYSLRSFRGSRLQVRIFRQLAGNLLLRTLDRAQRVHMAMLCRGFQGEIKVIRQSHFGLTEFYFTVGWCLLFTAMRVYDIPQFLGQLLLGSYT